VDQQRRAQIGEDLGRLRRVGRRVGRDADVERLAGPDRGVQRAHRLLERRRGVGPVRVEDVDVVQPHPAQRLVEAGQHVLASPTALAVGPGPHVVTGLGRDDQLVTVGSEVVAQVPAEVGLGGAVGRPVVVGQVEVRDAEVERPPQGRPLPLERHVVAEVVPETEADRREVEAAAARPAVGHRVVAVVGCAVGHPRIVPVRGGTRRAALSRGTQIASGSSGRSAPTDRSPTPSVRTCSGQNRSEVGSGG
jgi:hypothetical protein